MYKNHFGLQRRIFLGNAAGADVFVGPQTASILNGIKKALSAPDAVVTLTGPVGCGKSTAVAHSLGAISGKNAIVRVGRFPLQRGELLDLLFDHMRIQQRPQRGNQKFGLFRQLLFNLAQNDSRMFILVEDALFLGPDMLAELEAVTAADTGPSDGAAVVLMGDEYLKELLASKSLARLRQRIRLRRSLEPCGIEELRGYLRHCFRQAGGDFDRIFAGAAADHLHQLSGGILRVVNNLVESSMEAAAEAAADVVSPELISRTADEEFGLTGKFTRPPEFSSKRPDPRHSDDATAELVASSMPDHEPVSSPSPTAERAAVADDNIPELIQDTQPSLAILDDAPPTRTAMHPVRDTLPDVEKLSAELSTAPRTEAESAPESLDEPAVNTDQAAKRPPLAEPKRQPKSAADAKPKTRAKPDSAQPPLPKAEPKPAFAQAQPSKATRKPETETSPTPAAKAAQRPIPEPEFKLELEPEPGQEAVAEETIPTLSDATGTMAAASGDKTTKDDVPDWERDPTLAELRPDLDALERAMAVAQGRDPGAAEDPAPAPEPVAQDAAQDEKDDIPEITLDDSINRKVDRAALESKQRREEEDYVEEEPYDGQKETDKDAVTAGDGSRKEEATAELEEIAVGLSKAKSIEDVDDKMAETLFGEELSAAAAAVAAKVAEEAAAATATQDANPDAQAAQAEPATTAMEQEFETVWGERPSVDVSIESQIEDQKGGLDISASQRLATVRALNTGQPEAAAQNASAAPAPAGTPDSIEEQITTSLTQTMKALKVSPEPTAVNDDDDDDEPKGGFFSRFRRS